MDRQTFERLPIKKQVEFANERVSMTLKQIADEIGMPSSSLGKIFLNEGYSRKSGIYVKDAPEPSSTEVDLSELLPYKEDLLALIHQFKEQEVALDFSALHEFKDEDGKMDWSTMTFQIPKELHEKLDQYLDKRGYKKQYLLSLLVLHHLEK